MKEERQGPTMRQVRSRQILGALLWVFGLISPLVLRVFAGDIVCLAVMFGLMILGVTLLVSTLKDEVALNFERQRTQYTQQPLTVFSNIDQGRINAVFQHEGFQKEGLVWHKRCFSWSKDLIHYYGCLCEEQVVNWLEELETPPMAQKCMCVFLFRIAQGITPEDKTALRAQAISFLMQETLIPCRVAHTCIPILIDETTGEGYFLEYSKGIAVYAHGCRLLKRYFG